MDLLRQRYPGERQLDRSHGQLSGDGDIGD